MKSLSRKFRQSKCGVLSMFLVVGLALPGATVYADNGLESLKEAGKAFSQVAKQVSPAVVFISVEKVEEYASSRRQSPFDDEFFRRFFDIPMPDQFERGEPRQRRVAGQGSGFIVSEDGYILTNNHVVGDADEVVVQFQDGREYKAEIVGTDSRSDVAVIKIDEKDLPVLPLGDSDALEVGEWVLAIGSPFGLSHTLTAGIVSAKGRNSVGITDYENFIQTDAAINPGNSGGPLVDLNGKAVGMNTAIFSRSGGYMGIGFAIPINMVKGIMDQLIDNGEVTRGFLGVLIQNLTTELAESFGLENRKGVLIADVTDDSPAERAGVRRGDVVLEFDGRKVEEVGSFRNRVSQVMPGNEIEMVVWRDGKRKTIKVEIGTLPDSVNASASEPDVDRMDQLGFSVQELTPELAERFDYQDAKGVIVNGVEDNSPAERAGLRPGVLIREVNRMRIDDLDDFRRALRRSEPDEALVLLVTDGRGSRYIAIKKR